MDLRIEDSNSHLSDGGSSSNDTVIVHPTGMERTQNGLRLLAGEAFPEANRKESLSINTTDSMSVGRDAVENEKLNEAEKVCGGIMAKFKSLPRGERALISIGLVLLALAAIAAIIAAIVATGGALGIAMIAAGAAGGTGLFSLVGAGILHCRNERMNAREDPSMETTSQASTDSSDITAPLERLDELAAQGEILVDAHSKLALSNAVLLSIPITDRLPEQLPDGFADQPFAHLTRTVEAFGENSDFGDRREKIEERFNTYDDWKSDPQSKLLLYQMSLGTRVLLNAQRNKHLKKNSDSADNAVTEWYDKTIAGYDNILKKYKKELIPNFPYLNAPAAKGSVADAGCFGLFSS